MLTGNAVDELMEEFGLSEEEATLIAALEELGLVVDSDGETLLDVDPDAQINLVPNTEQTAAGWN